MTKQNGRRLPSPAMVVAAVALIAALAGTAVALPGKNRIDKNDLRKNVVKRKNIVKGAVNSFKVQNGAVQPWDLSATALAPRAYAHVTGDNQVTESRSRGVTDANVDIDTDVFCFSNLGFQPRHVQATVDGSSGVGVNPDLIIQAAVNPPGDSSTCDGEEQASVEIWDVSGAFNEIGADFYVAFFE